MNTFLFKLFIKFLRLYAKPSKVEIIEGDLIEIFIIQDKNHGSNRALLGLLWNIIRFFRWRYIKGFEDIKYLGSIAMIKNYLKISLRSLKRHKFFTLINISGLSLGIACCFMILLYIQDEMSYDQFIKDHDSVYRLSLNGYGASPSPFAFTAKDEYPEIDQAVRIIDYQEVTFEFNSQSFAQEGGLVVDSTFLDVFSLELMEGDPKTALVDPNSIILSKSMVLNHFNRVDIMDKFIKVDGINRKVTGIIEDYPTNSHIGFNYLVPFPKTDWVTNGSWTGNNFYTYFKLNESANIKDLEKKFKSFVRKHMASEILSFSGHESYDEFLEDDKSRKYNFYLYPIADLHLYHHWMSITEEGDLETIYIFSIIALFVLLIASINFMNLSTSRAGIRSKEVGVRKVLGSLKAQLRNQFLTESILISFFSLIVAVIITLVLLPYFNHLSGKSFDTTHIFTFTNAIILISIGLVTGILSGLYPAFYLSAIQPIIALKGVFKSKDSSFLRKGLVSFQFAISILLIICTIIVYAQVNYMTNKELGIKTEHTLIINNANKMGKNLLVFKKELASNANVRQISTANSSPATWIPNWGYYTNEAERKAFSPDHIFVSKEYQEVLGIELVKGEFFSGLATDSTSIVVNEALIRALDWNVDESIGKVLKRDESEKYVIKGIMKDFHLNSFRNNIRPLLLRYTNHLEQGNFGAVYMMIKINGDYQHVIKNIEEKWRLFAGNEILDYTFLDQKFDRLYDNERNFGKIFTTFSMIAIFIACLGLFALSAFMLEQRLKEVAMRKVLGASRLQITNLFIISFVKLISIGAVIAVPIAIYLAEIWLEDYTIRLYLNPFFFIAPIIGVMLIAFLTVTVQVMKAGNANPATILKSE